MGCDVLVGVDGVCEFLLDILEELDCFEEQHNFSSNASQDNRDLLHILYGKLFNFLTLFKRFYQNCQWSYWESRSGP